VISELRLELSGRGKSERQIQVDSFQRLQQNTLLLSPSLLFLLNASKTMRRTMTMKAMNLRRTMTMKAMNLRRTMTMKAMNLRREREERQKKSQRVEQR